MLNETARVFNSTGLAAQPVLEWRKRADPAGEFDGGTPDCGRNVQVRRLRPPQHQQTAEHDEHHKCEVDYKNDIGEEIVSQAVDLKIVALTRLPAYPPPT